MWNISLFCNQKNEDSSKKKKKFNLGKGAVTFNWNKTETAEWEPWVCQDSLHLLLNHTPSCVISGCIRVHYLLRLELRVQWLVLGVADLSLSSLYAYSSKLFSRTWVTRTSSFSYICVLKGRETTQRWARSSDGANQRRKWANSDFYKLVF